MPRGGFFAAIWWPQEQLIAMDPSRTGSQGRCKRSCQPCQPLILLDQEFGIRMHQSRWTYGYGSIPIDTFLVGWTSIYQLFWGSLGTRVLTHPHMKYDVNHTSIWSPRVIGFRVYRDVSLLGILNWPALINPGLHSTNMFSATYCAFLVMYSLYIVLMVFDFIILFCDLKCVCTLYLIQRLP